MNVFITLKGTHFGSLFNAGGGGGGWGGAFCNAQLTLSGQAQKAVFKLNSYLHNFPDISPKHVPDLFAKEAMFTYFKLRK